MKRSIATVFALAALFVALAASPAGAFDVDPYIAPTTACPGQTELEAPAEVQEQAMICMTNFARRHADRAGFSDDADLDRSALHKSGDILRCNSFSHLACGREFTYWLQRVGYLSARCWHAGENIAWGTGKLGTVRSIFQQWMLSQGHRENILGSYSQIGVGLKVGSLDGYANAHVWTQHFGSHC